MQRVRQNVVTLGGADVSVLITGESGVGKEVVAKNLHRMSARSSGPFISVNCAALAPGVLESELFGHAQGAFTGAVRSHVGVFEQASGGTLFLDEIGEIPADTQAKLLRVLQEREVRRVGDTAVRRVDVRLLSATNADLAAMVSHGTFRQDLFYRINVVELQIPPLRERGDDVFDLISAYFARKGQGEIAVPDETRNLVTTHPWPGNVRELNNELARVIALHGLPKVLRADMLSDRVRRTRWRPDFDVAVLLEAPLDDAVSRLERQLVTQTLLRTDWNKSRSARELGLSRQGLLNKIRRYGITRDVPGEKDESVP